MARTDMSAHPTVDLRLAAVANQWIDRPAADTARITFDQWFHGLHTMLGDLRKRADDLWGVGRARFKRREEDTGVPASWQEFPEPVQFARPDHSELDLVAINTSEFRHWHVGCGPQAPP